MATGDQTLILKVLSGSQFGVEISLSDGEYTFGKGEDADIQFTDLSLADTHGALRIASGKLEMRAIGAPVSTSSGLVVEPGEEAWREIAQLDKITAGTCVFAIATADAKWTSLTPVTSVESASAPRQSSGGGNRLAAIIAASAVVIACVFAILFLTNSNSSLPLIPRNVAVDNLTAVEDALAALPFRKTLDIAEEADGVISVTGYVATSAERRAVQNALLDTGAPIRRRIWALEAIRTDVEGLLESRPVQIEYTLASDGVLTLEGINLDSGPIEETVTLLETQVFGLAAVEDQVRTAEDYLIDVQALIMRVQLTDLVIARLDGLLIETTGVVPLDKTDNWVGFVQAFARQYADILPLRSFVTLEGQSNGAPTEPIIISRTETIVEGAGRTVAAEELVNNSTDAALLFAQPGDASDVEGISTAGAINVANLVRQLGGDGIDLQTTLDTFASENPEVVAAVLGSLTNGEVTTFEDLRTRFSAVNEANEEASTAFGPIRVATGETDALIEFFNQALTRVIEERERANSAIETDGSEPSPAQGPEGATSSGVVAVITDGAGDAATAPAAGSPTAETQNTANGTPIAREGETGALSGEQESEVLPLNQAGILNFPTGQSSETSDGSAISNQQDVSEIDGIAELQSPEAPQSATVDGPRALTTGQPQAGAADTVAAGVDQFESRPSDYQPTEVLDRMDAATTLLFRRNGAGDLVIDEEALRIKPELSLISEDLVSLALAQSNALSVGQTLISPPLPLPAQFRNQSLEQQRCWPGSSINVEALPNVLVWLDILSVNSDLDINQITLENRLLFMEAALNPGRTIDCLEGIDTAYSRALIESSAFLTESLRNDTFSEFLFRNVVPFPLEVVGIHLIGERYVQLINGRKLREGSAPTIESRVAVIGDLGVLLRVADGFQIYLYEDSVSWRVAEN